MRALARRTGTMRERTKPKEELTKAADQINFDLDVEQGIELGAMPKEDVEAV